MCVWPWLYLREVQRNQQGLEDHPLHDHPEERQDENKDWSYEESVSHRHKTQIVWQCDRMLNCLLESQVKVCVVIWISVVLFHDIVVWSKEWCLEIEETSLDDEGTQSQHRRNYTMDNNLLISAPCHRNVLCAIEICRME